MKTTRPLLFPLLAVAALAAVDAAVPCAAAEATRTIRVELSGSPSTHFMVENLAGRMTVLPGDGATVVAVATIHAEDEAIAAKFRFEQVRGKEGVPTLRVRYPIDDDEAVRYPRDGASGMLGRLFGGNHTTTEYDGHDDVRVSDTAGTLMYADVEVRLPKNGATDGRFRNVVGALSARDVAGTLVFDTGSGDVDVTDARGKLTADTGSGDVKAVRVSGTFVCDTGSGQCDIASFDGETLSCDVGSGDVTIRSAKARRVSVDTGSGDVHVLGSDIETFDADTGSGDVELENAGGRLTRVTADTGSGNVTLRLAPDATFEAHADQGSGDIVMQYKDAEPILRHKELLGYRRGAAARIRIDVDTGSGDLTIMPAR